MICHNACDKYHGYFKLLRNLPILGKFIIAIVLIPIVPLIMALVPTLFVFYWLFACDIHVDSSNGHHERSLLRPNFKTMLYGMFY